MARPVSTARASRTRPAIPALALSIVVLAACGAGDRAAPGPIVRDSAGITIVENTAPLWHENAAWSIDAEPEVEIGVLDGDPAYQLYHARDAARLSDGRIVVANYGTGKLRYFDAHGRHLTTVGGKSGGPGEFTYLGGILRLPDDSILASNLHPPRVSIFDPEGRYVRSVDMGAPLGRMADGTLVRLEADRSLDNAQTGPRRRPLNNVLHSPAGHALDTIAQLPGNESYALVEQSENRVAASVFELPFGRSQSAAVSDDTHRTEPKRIG